jgi:hypothetical protein
MTITHEVQVWHRGRWNEDTFWSNREDAIQECELLRSGGFKVRVVTWTDEGHMLWDGECGMLPRSTYCAEATDVQIADRARRKVRWSVLTP